MKHCIFLTIALLYCTLSCAQTKSVPMPDEAVDPPTSVTITKELPYREIPEAPAEYTACNVVARMVDGLGFRYYWATEGLRDEDLAYRARETSRTTAETLDHLYGLAEMVRNTVLKRPNVRPQEAQEMTFAHQRQRTLEMLWEASTVLRSSSNADMEEMEIVFLREDNRSAFPFWNNLNGPLADALWHTGQIVMLRRASGNPFNSKASVFSGKVRE